MRGGTVAPTDERSGEDLLLKVTPPRVPRHLLSRTRLRSDTDVCRGQGVVVVRAPAGFGKTSLLAQWRLEQVANGRAVAWLSAEPEDGPERLLRALTLSVRQATARPGFGQSLAARDGAPRDTCIAVWLAELAQAAVPVTLSIDQADHLPPASQALVAQIVRHAPPNLQVLLAARGPIGFAVDDLVDYGRCTVMGAGLLRFRLDETLELLRRSFGDSVDNDLGARVQEFTEGWALGLQLVLSLQQEDEGLAALAAAARAPGGELRQHLAGLLLGAVADDDMDFLCRMACLGRMHPGLCRAIDGRDGAAVRLARLGLEAPAVVRSEHGEWSRLHTVARDVLRARFAALPSAERAEVHARAAAWYERQGLLEDAAEHALAAGQPQAAYDLVDRCLYDAVVRQGRHAEALDWLDRLPPAELQRRPRLMLAMAWSLAGSERHAEAAALVGRLVSEAGEADHALRCECALVLSGAAMFADEPDLFCTLHDAWEADPPLRTPELLRLHAHRSAYRALLDGQTALARLRLQRQLQTRDGEDLQQGDPWGRYLMGLSYLWEGQPLLAESLLRPALAVAEAASGRRGRLPSLLAAVLATALWELDRPREAAELLANRLDVLERTAPAEALLLAYRTLVRVALASRTEHRAIELLESMQAVAQVRRMPRLELASLAELVRVHARGHRAQMCHELCQRIDELAAGQAQVRPRWWRLVAGLPEQAHAYAAIATRDWRRAIERLAAADDHARRMRMGSVHIELLGLRAFVLDRCGERSHTLLREAVELAGAFELRRLLADAHPGLGVLVAGLGETPPAMPSLPVFAGGSAPVWSALTNKEREVLQLLSRNLSNKEIGRALQSGETTVKWHVKNLFSKLDVGSRREVVVRARALGMLPAVD